MSKIKESTEKAKRKGAGVWAEFKAFAFKGNVIDMAVGVIIATAFSKIVSSLVADVFMPIISWLIGSGDYTNANIILVPEVLTEAGEVITPAVTMLLGNFIKNVVDFFLMAVIVFVFIKVISKMTRKKKEEPKPQEPPKPSKEEILLTEIRDLLKDKNQ